MTIKLVNTDMKKINCLVLISLLLLAISCSDDGSKTSIQSGGGSSNGVTPGGGSASDLEKELTDMAGSFTIPEGAVSVTLLADAGIEVGDLTMTRMTGPDNSEYVDNSFARTIMPTFIESSATRTIPDGDYTAQLSGTWNYQFNCGSCIPKTKKALWKTSEGSNLNVNIVLVLHTTITSEDDPNLLEVMDHFKTFFSTAGINISEIKYTFIESGDTIIISADSNNNGQFDSMDRLLVQSADVSFEHRDDYIHIFIVQSISETGVAGISGGIPGPPMAGTPHSGVLVSSFGGATFRTAAERKIFADVMAHEAIHFLGLYHTSEEGGVSFDPISDTPQCVGGNTPLEECPDVTNIMFWTIVDGVGPLTVTDGQKFVLRRAHLIK